MTCHTLVSQPQSSHPWNISLKHYYRGREHGYIGYPYEKAYSGTRFFPWQFLEFQCRQFVRSLCVSQQRKGFFRVPWSNDTAVPLGAGLPSHQAAVLYQDKTASAKPEKIGIFFVTLHKMRLFRYLIAFMQLFIEDISRNWWTYACTKGSFSPGGKFALFPKKITEKKEDENSLFRLNSVKYASFSLLDLYGDGSKNPS